MAPLFRILLVDDFELFRRFVRLTLQPRSEFEIVAEAVNGYEAVQKAQDLQPDLILLDIGLPKMDGMEAAERIRLLAPDAKVLFVSLESSPAVVREAFRLGARGYVHKLRAQSELLPAIDAVLAGGQFVSGDLAFSDSTKPRRRHEVQFYSDEMVFLESSTRFISSALKADSAAIVLATKSHRERLVQRLTADGFDVNEAIQQGTYVSLDAAEALSMIMVDGRPDHARFHHILSELIESSGKVSKTENPRVAVFGECVGLLCAEGNTHAAIEIENTGNELLATHRIDIMCAYPLSAFQRTDGDSAIKSICSQHTAVFTR